MHWVESHLGILQRIAKNGFGRFLMLYIYLVRYTSKRVQYICQTPYVLVLSKTVAYSSQVFEGTKLSFVAGVNLINLL